MDKLDKTKDNLGLSNIDEKVKKELFEKFVDAGGKVVSDREKRIKRLTIDREKQKELLKKYDTQKKKNVNPQIRRPVKKASTQSPVKRSSSSPDAAMSFFSKLKLRFKLKFLGLTSFSGYYFSPKLFERFNNIYKASLLELQIAYLELFKKDPATGRKIIERLDRLKPLYYEIIEMTGNLYDKISTDRITDHYTSFPDVPQKTFELKGALMGLYKKLHVLFQYDNSILIAFNKAIELHRKIENGKHSYYSSIRKKIRSSLFITFHKLYPRLHLLFCFYYKKELDYYDPAIAKILAIANTDRPGNRILKQLEDPVDHPIVQTDSDAQEDELDDSKDPYKAKAIRAGLQLMYDLDLKRLRKEYDTDFIFENVSDNDKVLNGYILFNEFDNEYSVILTTNKIKFSIDVSNRATTDYRAKLSDLYNNMRICSDNLKEYAEELSNYEKVRKEKPPDSSKYIEYTKRLEIFEKKKNEYGSRALTSIRKLMMRIAEELRALIDDMENDHRYIENPQEVLEFDPLIEGEKKINGKKVYEAIYITYSFAEAFIHRLEQGGDLAGSISKETAGDEVRQKKGADSASSSETLPEEKGQGGSILEELDDIL